MVKIRADYISLTAVQIILQAKKTSGQMGKGFVQNRKPAAGGWLVGRMVCGWLAGCAQS